MMQEPFVAKPAVMSARESVVVSFRPFDSLNNNYTLLERFPCSRGEAGSGSAKPLLSGCFRFHFPH